MRQPTTNQPEDVQPHDNMGAGPIASLLGLDEKQTAELRRLLSPRPVE